MVNSRLTALERIALTALCASLSMLSQADIRALASPTASSASAGCQIRVSLLQSGLKLEAISDAHKAIAGDYRLTVVKESESGSSRNVQSGAFHADPGQPRILATIILDRSAIGHYSATLALEWNDGHESCSSS